MDRRQVIKNLALSFGYTIAAPTVISLLNACSNTKTTHVFNILNANQKFCISNLVDIIIPKSNIPGALDINIVEFIDIMVSETFTNKEQDIFFKGSIEFEKLFEKTFEKTISEGSQKELEQILNSYFLISEKEKNDVFNLLKKDIEKITIQKKQSFLIYKYLTTVRELCVFGYCTSKVIVEEVLINNSNLGYYKSCVAL
ncbi:MAG: gluconate 2-dehydrogenase subunit 3 family protein [Flavobacteriaceae bacterium]|nr:gluconate 2-dehydrogenase subunit 3 family protein [Flavobacteriaceae bacterium]